MLGTTMQGLTNNPTYFGGSAVADADSKTCTLCGVTKLLGDFAKRKERRCSHCKACVCARVKQYMAAGGAEYKAKKKAYDVARVSGIKEFLSEQAKARYERSRPEKIAAAKAWVSGNPEKRAAIAQNYKHRRRAQEAGGISSADLLAWKRTQPKVCYWCGKKCAKSFTVDHYTALSKGGKHEAANLVIACRTCNVRKNAKDPEQFRAESWPGSLFSGLIP